MAAKLMIIALKSTGRVEYISHTETQKNLWFRISVLIKQHDTVYSSQRRKDAKDDFDFCIIESETTTRVFDHWQGWSIWDTARIPTIRVIHEVNPLGGRKHFNIDKLLLRVNGRETKVKKIQPPNP